MPRFSIFNALVLGGACLLFCSCSLGQDSGDGNGERGSDRGERDRRGRGGDQSWDVESFLRRLDANGNGQLESSEMSGRTARYIEGLGFDTSRDVSIKEVILRVNGEEKSTSSDSSQTKSESGRVIERLVPGFETTASKDAKIPGFGSSVSTKSIADITKEYGESVAGQVERAMRRYDKNENGVLEADELEQGQWGNPSPQESDKNGDGALTRSELAERYKGRDNASERGPSSDDSSGDRSSSSRGDDSGDRGSRFSRGESGGSDENTPTRTPAGSSSSSSSSGSSASSSDRMRSYAEQLVKQYDKDSDGQLNKEEISSMRRIPTGADGNGDGMVTAGELTDALVAGNKTVSTTTTESPGRGSGSSRTNRRSSNTDSGDDSDGASSRRESSSTSFSFNSNDENGDGQVQMHEFAKDWTDDRFNEFQALDKNSDGVITAEEYTQRDQ